jgi:hypothetical protein
LLAHWLSETQACPLPHLPQSELQKMPELEPPQLSVPSHRASPQRWMQKPAVQFPLWQARLVVHGLPAERSPALQKPKLHRPLAQELSLLQADPFPSRLPMQEP